MEPYGQPMIDGDSHVYEDVEAWMSYMPSKYKADYEVGRRLLDNGRFAIHIGGKPISFGEEYMRPDGTIPKPGALAEWLRAHKEGLDAEHLWVQPTADVRNVRDRLVKMDEFNVAASVVFPSEAIALLPFLDVKGLSVVMEAYNRYLLDNWGFVTQDRVYCTAFLHLQDLDWALRELDWALAKGCRAIVIPTGPAQRASPGDPKFDAFWSRVNEAEAILGLHISQATYLDSLLIEWGGPLNPPITGKSAWDWMNTMDETPIVHTLSSLIYLNFFERFPNIRALSAENGSEWVPAMLTRMDKMRGFAKNGRWPCGQMKERPSAVFKRHVFVVPYPEDDMRAEIDATGTADCFVMGSDYPHAEGCAEPRVFMAGMHDIRAEEERKIMYDNGARLIWQ